MKLFDPIFHGLIFEDFLPNGSLTPFLKYCWEKYLKTWALRGILVFLGCYFLSYFLENPYFINGAEENFSPLWWNLVTVAGLVWMCLANIIRQLGNNPVTVSMTKTAYSMLGTASEIGAFSCGLLSGMLLMVLLTEPFSSFIEYVRFTFGFFLLFVVFFLNMIVWCFTYCLKEDVQPPYLFKKMQSSKGLAIGSNLFFIVVLLFFTVHAKPHPKQVECPPSSETYQ